MPSNSIESLIQQPAFYGHQAKVCSGMVTVVVQGSFSQMCRENNLDYLVMGGDGAWDDESVISIQQRIEA